MSEVYSAQTEREENADTLGLEDIERRRNALDVLFNESSTSESLSALSDLGEDIQGSVDNLQ